MRASFVAAIVAGVAGQYFDVFTGPNAMAQAINTYSPWAIPGYSASSYGNGAGLYGPAFDWMATTVPFTGLPTYGRGFGFGYGTGFGSPIGTPYFGYGSLTFGQFGGLGSPIGNTAPWSPFWFGSAGTILPIY